MTTLRPPASLPMCNASFTIICGVASWRTGFSAWAVTPVSTSAGALQLQATRVLPIVCRTTHGPDGGTSRRAGHPLGPHAAMGGVGTDPLALLDGVLAAPHG